MTKYDLWKLSSPPETLKKSCEECGCDLTDVDDVECPGCGVELD